MAPTVKIVAELNPTVADALKRRLAEQFMGGHRRIAEQLTRPAVLKHAALVVLEDVLAERAELRMERGERRR
jgi:hypothetical protein